MVELGVPRPVDDIDLDELRESPERFVNRELSWLDFNARVLALADDPRPAAARAGQVPRDLRHNLDEFFQVRVAGLKDQVAAGLRQDHPRRAHAPRDPARRRSASG